MGPTRVNRKLSFESGEEQIKGYGKVTQNTEIFSTKYGNNILEVGTPEKGNSNSSSLLYQQPPTWKVGLFLIRKNQCVCCIFVFHSGFQN